MTTETSGEILTLTTDQCWELLDRLRLGRLAVGAAGTIDIMPVNFVPHKGKIYFRTSRGTKLATLTVSPRVAFETDEVSHGTARSVVVHGVARELERDEEEQEIDRLDLLPLIPGPKFSFVEITPTSISGRQFEVAAEPGRYW